MPFLSVQRWFAMGKETTRGTGVAPTLWLPIDPNPSLAPMPTYLEDTGLRGSPGVDYTTQIGVRHDEFSFKGNMFGDTMPALLLSILGGADTVTGTGPYVHTIGLANAPSTGSQPPSWTGADVDNHTQTGGSAKQWAGGMIDTLSATFNADGAAQYSAKFLANPFTEITPPAITFSTLNFIPAWNCALSIGGSSSAVVESGTIDIKRSTKVINTLGQQSPYRIWAGGIEVSGKFTFVAEANDLWFSDGLTVTPLVVVMTFTDPVSNDSIEFQMSSVQLKSPKIDSSKDWLEIQTDFIANMNTTDATASGFSPLKTISTNAKSTAY